jgi:hypothetical protein
MILRADARGQATTLEFILSICRPRAVARSADLGDSDEQGKRGSSRVFDLDPIDLPTSLRCEVGRPEGIQSDALAYPIEVPEAVR